MLPHMQVAYLNSYTTTMLLLLLMQDFKVQFEVCIVQLILPPQRSHSEWVYTHVCILNMIGIFKYTSFVSAHVNTLS